MPSEPRCAICRNIHPTSTRSNCLTANSRRTCASLPHAPSPASTAPSARSCAFSSRGNAPIITNMQAMLPYDRNPRNEAETRELQVAARTLGLHLLIVKASDPREFEAAFETLARERAGGLL